MRYPLTRDEIQSPDRILYRMIADYVEGRLDANRVFYRASVVAIDHVGGQFEVSPPNPKNSVKARIITDGYDAYTSDEDLPVFWPMSSHNVEPVKELEHVYVLFEDPNKTHGLWLSRIPEPLNVDSKNYVAGSKKYVAESKNELSPLAAEQAVAGMPDAPTPVLVDPEFAIEDEVPFTPRTGDRVIYGSNNTAIILGRDRPSAESTFGQRFNAGSIDIVAGRAIPEQVDLLLDKASVYVCANTQADLAAGTVGVKGLAEVPDPLPAAGGFFIADNVRVVARKSLKLYVQNGDVTLAANKINIGNLAPEAAVLGDTLKDLLSQLIQQIEALKILTPAGPGSVSPDAVLQLKNLNNQLSTMLSKDVKVK